VKYFPKTFWIETFGEPFKTEHLQKYAQETTDARVIEFLEHASLPKSDVFIEWIEQTQSLHEVLNYEKDSKFIDSINILKHSLCNEFKCFVSPFLYPRLLSILKEKTFSNAIEHFVLLDNEKKYYIEKEIHNETIEQLKKLQIETIDLKQWEELLTQIMSEQRIAIYNSFSKTAYSLKMDFVEKSISVLRKKQCSVQVANWIAKQLLKIEMTQDHYQQLKQRLPQILQSKSHTKVRQKKIKQRLIFKVFVWTIVLLLLLCFIIYLIINN